jgi:uncharacterized protein (TIGR02611 family)
MTAVTDDLARWEGEGGAIRGSPEPVPALARRQSALRVARKVAIGVAGGSVLLAGIALLFLPGPAIVVIPIGLAILATEFVWARRLILVGRDQLRRALQWARRRREARRSHA